MFTREALYGFVMEATLLQSEKGFNRPIAHVRAYFGPINRAECSPQSRQSIFQKLHFGV